MAKHGVAGMSMRDLAAAAGCNVATIYHHFESKQALLAAVLEEASYLEVLSGPVPVVPSADPRDTLEALFAQMLEAMLGVEDFVRLMLGESLRGDPVVMEVGRELLESTGEAIRRWLTETNTTRVPKARDEAAARVARAALIGFFFEYLTASFSEGEARGGEARGGEARGGEARGGEARPATDLVSDFAHYLAVVLARG